MIKHTLYNLDGKSNKKLKQGKMKMTQLRKFRTEKGLTQCDMARLSGVNHSAVSLYENGIDKPAYTTALKFSKVLGMPVEKLFPGLTLRGAPRGEMAVNHE